MEARFTRPAHQFAPRIQCADLRRGKKQMTELLLAIALQAQWQIDLRDGKRGRGWKRGYWLERHQSGVINRDL